MTTAEIRDAFIKFFEEHGHTRVESSPLIPAGDPTLLFTNAGMVQFKDTFLGTEKRPYVRAVTSQKCIRISGKHNDLENVGRTARHHTFFEMLGNFSFGDYFKQDAILFGWKFVTERLGLSKDRLWVTVYEDDDEAEELWKTLTDVLPGRILRRGKDDNFWAMGETGPCGPCSEIFYFLGEANYKQKSEELLQDNPLYVEIWNLVFMQFNRDPAGNLNPLPKPSVDTGMGLERVSAAKQGKLANYDCDLFQDIIKTTEKLSGKKYLGQDYTERDPEKDTQYAHDVAFRVVADHVRAAAFLIADGIQPSSDGRGYVLRRLVRRACRHGRVLGFSGAFLHDVSSSVVELMGGEYPELLQNAEKIKNVLKREEEKFLVTFDTGLQHLKKEIERLKQKNLKLLSGEIAFQLHDTFGFPLDMTEDILRTFGLGVDVEGFSKEMEKQRERSRAARASETTLILQKNVKPSSTVFRGYDYLEYEAAIVGLYSKDGELGIAREGDEIALVALETPFYGESGGQIGDTGTISTPSGALDVVDTLKVGGDTIVHVCRVVEGEVSRDEIARFRVDGLRRQKLRVHHSATHLIHLALRDVLGEHIKQAGSRVSDANLRFDFSHHEQISEEQLKEIEFTVHRLIQENADVRTEVLPLEEAKKSGAVALFGEKYGDSVRVVQIGARSRELCGGTHVNRAGDIGSFVLLGDSAVSAGVRRIEARAGISAVEELLENKQLLQEMLRTLQVNKASGAERLQKTLERVKELEKEVSRMGQKVQATMGSDLSSQIKERQDGTKVLAAFLENVSPESLRTMADDLRGRMGTGCLVLASVSEGKAILLTAVTENLTSRYHAGNLMKELTAVIGSRGGGRADLAQAGGGDPGKISEALKRFEELIQ